MLPDDRIRKMHGHQCASWQKHDAKFGAKIIWPSAMPTLAFFFTTKFVDKVLPAQLIRLLFLRLLNSEDPHCVGHKQFLLGGVPDTEEPNVSLCSEPRSLAQQLPFCLRVTQDLPAVSFNFWTACGLNDLSVFSPSDRYRILHMPLCCRTSAQAITKDSSGPLGEAFFLPPSDLRRMCKHRKTTICSSYLLRQHPPMKQATPFTPMSSDVFRKFPSALPHPATKFRYRAAKKHVVHHVSCVLQASAMFGTQHWWCSSSHTKDLFLNSITFMWRISWQGLDLPMVDER